MKLGAETDPSFLTPSVSSPVALDATTSAQDESFLASSSPTMSLVSLLESSTWPRMSSREPSALSD